MRKNMALYWGSFVETQSKTRGQKFFTKTYARFAHVFSKAFSTAKSVFSYLLRVTFYSLSTLINNNNVSKYLFSSYVTRSFV